MVLKGVIATTVGLAVIIGVVIGSMFLLPLLQLLTYKNQVLVTVTLNYEVSDADLSLLLSIIDPQNYRYIAERDVSGAKIYYGSKFEDYKNKLNETILKLRLFSNYSLKGNEVIVSYGKLKIPLKALTFVAKPYNPKKLTEGILLEVEK